METEENIVEKHRNCLERGQSSLPLPKGCGQRGAGWGPDCRFMHRTFPHVAFGFQTAG